MLSLEFWGNCAKEYAEKSSVGKDVFIQEMGTLGLDVGKDVKDNQKNPQYQAVKNRCVECQNSEEMIKTAKACSARSHSQASKYQDMANKR